MKNIFGYWKVFRTDNNKESLGNYVGYVDEVALHLANKTSFPLIFRLLVSIDMELKPTKNKVSIVMENDQIFNNDFEKMFKYRPVFIEKNGYKNSVTLYKNKPQSIIDKEVALNKLTEYEKTILHLI